MSRWSAGWAALLGAGLALELAALRPCPTPTPTPTPAPRTLSAHVWQLLGPAPRPRWIAGAALWLALTDHLLLAPHRRRDDA